MCLGEHYSFGPSSARGIAPLALLVYLNFAQISDNLFGWLESKEQLLSQYCTSSCRAKPAKTLKAALDYGMSIVLLFWAKLR